MLPTAGLSFQVTLTPEDRFSTANCCVVDTPIIAVAGLTLVDGSAAGPADLGPALIDLAVVTGVEGNGAGDGLRDPAYDAGSACSPVDVIVPAPAGTLIQFASCPPNCCWRWPSVVSLRVTWARAVVPANMTIVDNKRDIDLSDIFVCYNNKHSTQGG
jgi:hypothetical protein